MVRPPASATPDQLPQAARAAPALLALARAARSLVLYDAGNDIVRIHLSEYHLKMSAALALGELTVTVSPFQLAVGGSFVLEDRDREKSLPYKLYRDGVRVIRFLPDTPWQELLELLRIVALRYASVRQQEEDTVTLVRRADFRFVRVETIEGFAQLEEFPEPEVPTHVDRAPQARPPAGWDMPLQKLPAPGALAYLPIPDEALAELADAGDEGSAAELSLSVASDLLAEAMRAEWPTPNPDLARFFTELRDALLIDGKLGPLRELMDLLARAGASDVRDQMLRGLADARTLELVLATVPEEEEHLPPELASFLPLLGVHPALDQLAATRSEGRRRLLTKLVLARLPREVDAVLGHLGAFDPAVVRVLADGIATRAPDRVQRVVRELLSHRDELLRIEALNVIEKAEARIPLRPVCGLLHDPAEAVRIRAAEVLGLRGDASVADALCACVAEMRAFSEPLAAAAGRALAIAAPSRAAALFPTWIEPKTRFLVGLTVLQRAQQCAAVAGLGAVPGADAERTLRALAERADGDVRRHCLAVLARRQREGRHG